MSHAIYQTPALILRTKNMRESNKLAYLYTQKFGLVYADTQSLRELKSKMRYHMHPYSLVDLDLVAGKSIWRVTGIHEKKTSFDIVGTPWFELTAIVSDMLIRLCTGEEENGELWDDIVLFFENFSRENENHMDEYEIIAVVRILFNLGYWDTEDAILHMENPYTEETFQYVSQKKQFYISHINKAFESSQL